ncbi:uncharacterized protein MONBRDRAFT_27837 [Monosiga brevicollis MX1]|uniref:Ras-related protein Rab-28 n=1 Tax=Monosiga brevicollis TaxID=81824 RepID=A9V6L6_MONBE|nr:uncharacterized protein MONBRDRAFT_27837 [Monosiga brevicollis MX1]EDQ86754.1 predicted protein [Monosiga brevicollis MX1]|eukprot:XP_001748299.1 hypothetical protein [Monosiga brevicollis MX1]
MASQEDAAETYKIVVLGNGTSGKTSVIRRYCQDGFGNAYNQTIGLDFFMKRLNLPGDKYVTLQIWDIGGQAIGGKMIRNYLENAKGVILVYDITNRDSFEDLADWYQLVVDTCSDSGMPHVGLMANKMDLAHMRAVPAERHDDFAARHQMLSFSVCAKDGSNVDLSFRQLVAKITRISISPAEMEAFRTKRMTAGIVNHPKAPSDPSTVPKPSAATQGKPRSTLCHVM